MTGGKPQSAAEKAAVVLLALGEELASAIVAQLSKDEAVRVATALSRLGRVDPAVADAVLNEFKERLTAPHSGVRGDGDATRRLIAAALARKGIAADLSGVVDLATPALMETVAQIDAPALAAYLRHEHPQTIALTLAHADARKSGETLKRLPPALHVEVIRRIAHLEAVDPEVLHELAESLRGAAERARAAPRAPVGGAAAVAALLNAQERDAAAAALAGLEQRDPALAAAVRALMFTFADLARLDDRGLQAVLKTVPEAQLKLALRGAPEALAARIFANMSERKAALLKEDIAAMRPAKRADVEAAQREIAALARRLLDAGTVALPEAG